jgi:hypothetical protein
MRTMMAVAILVGSWAGSALAEELPRFDIEATCRGVPSLGADNNPVQACIQDESAARDQLRAEWASFSPANQRECVSETEIAGLPSYVDVLTCLQMYRDNAVTTTLKSRRKPKAQ